MLQYLLTKGYYLAQCEFSGALPRKRTMQHERPTSGPSSGIMPKDVGRFGGFHGHGGTPFHAKSQSKMDDELEVPPHFRKPPCEISFGTMSWLFLAHPAKSIVSGTDLSPSAQGCDLQHITIHLGKMCWICWAGLVLQHVVTSWYFLWGSSDDFITECTPSCPRNHRVGAFNCR